MSYKNPMDILLVDDSESLNRTLSLVLARKGYITTTARDGLEAVQKVTERPFDLVLMDIKMPRMNGVEAYRRIQEVRPGTTVILMTAYAVDDLIQVALAEGAYGVVYKPLDLERVIGLIEKTRTTRAQTMILLVDDQPGLCATLQMILRRRGCEVLVAHNGEDAIEHAKHRTFDLILLDMKLPTIDGFDTYLGIRKHDTHSVVVIMTGYRNELEERIQQALSACAYACLYKPLDVEKLISLLDGIRDRPATCEPSRG